ncbi:hypothetical protein J1614_001683 [Plenodomus biglobosus]|nr:hypothetical protein J1614_001683 [Plenodomus biglobosus]
MNDAPLIRMDTIGNTGPRPSSMYQNLHCNSSPCIRMKNDDAAQNTKSQRVDPVLSKPLTSCTTLATDVILDFGLYPKAPQHDDVIIAGVTYKLALLY